MRFKTRLAALLMAMLLTISLCGCGSSDSLERVLQNREIVFGIAPDSFPLSYGEQDSPEGLSVDVGREIAKRLNVNARFLMISQERAEEALSDGAIDCYLCFAAPGVKASARMQTIDCLIDCRAVAVTASSSDIDQLFELKGRVVSVASGSDAADSLLAAEVLCSGLAELRWTSDSDTAMDDVRHGRTDAAVMDAQTYNALSKNDRYNFAPIHEALSDGDYVIAFRLRDDTLFERVGVIFKDMCSDGKVSSIYLEHLGIDPLA